MAELDDAALVGAWALLSCRVRDADGATIAEPLGPRPGGLLIYTADGHVAVHAMAAPPAARGAAADAYFGYAGTWRREGRLVRHAVDVASFPNWSGTVLVRDAELRDNVLVLSGESSLADERAALFVMTWRRVGDGDLTAAPG